MVELAGDAGVELIARNSWLVWTLKYLRYFSLKMQRYMCTVSVHDYIFIKSTSWLLCKGCSCKWFQMIFIDFKVTPFLSPCEILFQDNVNFWNLVSKTAWSNSSVPYPFLLNLNCSHGGVFSHRDKALLNISGKVNFKVHLGSSTVFR